MGVKFKFSFVFFVFLLFLTACGGSDQASQNNDDSQNEEEKSANNEILSQLSIGTASTAGHFYPIGVAMADLITDNIDGVTATGEETGGSNANIGLLKSKEIEIGMTAGEIGVPAFKGEPPFDEKANILLGWHIFEDTLQIVALKDSDISTMEDLKGKTISLGPSGSSSNLLVKEMLDHHGIKDGEYKEQFLNVEQQGDALKDGTIDAGSYMGAFPIAGVEGVAAQNEITIVAMDPEKITESNPILEPTEIPAGTYSGQDESVVTVGMPAYLWFRDDLSEEQVYEITKTVFENMEDIISVDRVAEQTKLLSKAEAEKIGVEVHPGVIKYATELGVWE